MTSSHSDGFYKKTISSHCLDLQKEKGLLSIWYAFRPQGFLDKTVRVWSRDTAINNFKNEIWRFLGYDKPSINSHEIS